MQSVIAISLLSTITLNISLNVINQKNMIIDKQSIQLEKYQKQLTTYQHNIKCNEEVIKQQNQVIQNQINKLNLLNTELKQAKDANKHFKYLGKFLITYYDLSFESCGKNKGDKGYGITRSGNPAEVTVSCAVDTSVIPMGSYIYLEGTGCRIAQDTGNKVIGNHVDIYVNDFSYDKYSTHYTDVYLIK